MSVIGVIAFDGEVHLDVPVRNVGAGVARLLAAAVTIGRDGAFGEPVARGEVPSAIAQQEHDRVTFPGSVSGAEGSSLEHLLMSSEDLVIEVAYSGLAGRREAATSLYMTKSGMTDRAYRVRPVVPGAQRRFTRTSAWWSRSRG